MNLDDLLADVEGIGEDSYVPSASSRDMAIESDSAVKDGSPAPKQLGQANSNADTVPEKPPLTDNSSFSEPSESIDMVLDVDFELTVRLGQAVLPLKEMMALQPGSQFLLEQKPEEPLDIYVDDQLIAHGEALIVDGMLAVQIVQLLKK